MNEKSTARSNNLIERIMNSKLLSPLTALIEKIFKTKITTLMAELFKSTAVGGLGVVINVSLYFLYDSYKNQLGLEGWIYDIIILVIINIINILISFFLQKYFTFKKVNNTGIQLVKFILQSISYMLLDVAFTRGFTGLLHLHPKLSKLISVFILFFYSFLTQKLWIFKK